MHGEPLTQLIACGDHKELRAAIIAVFAAPWSATTLCHLDATGVLTTIFPELEPSRTTEQPRIHFLPVLAHSIETVAAVDWLLHELTLPSPTGETATPSPHPTLPAALHAHPTLHYTSTYADTLRQHFTTHIGPSPRIALLKLATLLHDIAKPQTRRTKPDGAVSFHAHQTQGADIARHIADRLGFDIGETHYIATIVRDHMRPGQLAAQSNISWRAMQRFFADTNDAGPDVLLHALADHMATRGPHLNPSAWLAQASWVDSMLDTIWGPAVEITRPLVNGNELMQALGIGPGPIIGRLLAALGEAQAGGDITTPDQALQLARRLITHLHIV